MRQVARKGLITVAAAGGILAAGAGFAHADAGAIGGAAHSPGVASGNSVQVPVHVPVNVCGNTVDVVGLLNPAFGNNCANGSGGKHASPGHHDQGGKNEGAHHGGAAAVGGAKDSPGVASGNSIQAPIDVPVNACGNSVDVVGLLNPAFGNNCANDAQVPPTNPEHPDTPNPPEHRTVPPTPVHHSTPKAPGLHPQTAAHTKIATPEPVRELAHTGAGSIGYAIPASAGLLLGGAVLYRRARTARR
ncbi:chaplin [Streptomyces pinistramenti]|uniref:chaplin n=1 Tax=Streptomyces pinistramenti TaxID=2884812 RepID=UPI001D0962D8|nr:chaplin [Streptomyces pinistramenti]MCB5909932.1 chaplin [Streptomyces pinistramenti]